MFLFVIYREINKTTNCLIKQDIGNLESFTWISYFPRYVVKFGFEDYLDLSFNRMGRYSIF